MENENNKPEVSLAVQLLQKIMGEDFKFAKVKTLNGTSENKIVPPRIKYDKQPVSLRSDKQRDTVRRPCNCSRAKKKS